MIYWAIRMREKKRSKSIIVANWKMNPVTLAEAKKIFTSTLKLAKSLKKTLVYVAPPYLYIPNLVSKSKTVRIGAQDGRSEDFGAFTGDVSLKMVEESGAHFVILGHSERRAQGETDGHISKKISTAISLSLEPIVCIGEPTRDVNGDYLRFLEKQILGSLSGLSSAFVSHITIAYEPVWAIGSQSKGAMDPRDLHETVLYIRKVLRTKFGAETGDSIKIIYGGSVDAGNASSLIEHGMVQGFLVGRASLDGKIFGEIIRAVENPRV